MIYSYKFLLFHIGLGVLSYLGYKFLVDLKTRSTSSKLRSAFHIPSVKSNSGAVLLGGVVFSVVSILGFSVLLYQYKFSNNEKIIAVAWVSAHTILSVFGYLDDRFELRASAKLFGQAISCFIFAFIACRTIQSNSSAIYLSVFFIWGMGVVNGSNLLDGIDTISIKLSLSIYGLFFAMGLWFQLHTLPVVTLIFAIPMATFYFFNREPSKVHLGEIGGTTIGLSYLFLAAMTFNSMYAERTVMESSNALFLSLMPLHLPMAELGVSFIRRMYNGKSPFIGDRHHVHYILRDFYNLGATKTATLYSLGHLLNCSIMFMLSILSPALAFFSGGALYLLCFISVGKEFWTKKKVDAISFFSYFRHVKKKEINIINTADIEKFSIELIEPNSDDFEQDKVA